MEGKIIVVTGASGALGKVVAASALAKGAKVDARTAKSNFAGRGGGGVRLIFQ